jgi:hypothetical protein
MIVGVDFWGGRKSYSGGKILLSGGKISSIGRKDIAAKPCE